MHYKPTLLKDKRLRALIKAADVPLVKKKKHIHLHLCDAVISQQLSVKVATVIYNRFLAQFSVKYPGPELILSIPFDQLRAVGLSNAKAHYIRNICTFFIEESLTDAKLYRMNDEALIAYLVQIKGIGRWTVEMILMSCMGREDVFAADDLGIRQSMCALYQLDSSPAKTLKQKMEAIAEQWRPYRTYACRYLWGWKDQLPN